MNNSAQSTMELTARNRVETLTEVISYDLRKIGYRYPGVSVNSATPTRLTFVSDLDNDGTADNISWQADTTASIHATKNPDDFPVYRILNGDTTDFSSAVTTFEFTYYDSTGVPTTVLTDISAVKIKISCQSPEQAGYQYSRSVWEKRFYPRNI